MCCQARRTRCPSCGRPASRAAQDESLGPVSASDSTPSPHASLAGAGPCHVKFERFQRCIVSDLIADHEIDAVRGLGKVHTTGHRRIDRRRTEAMLSGLQATAAPWFTTDSVALSMSNTLAASEREYSPTRLLDQHGAEVPSITMGSHRSFAQTVPRCACGDVLPSVPVPLNGPRSGAQPLRQRGLQRQGPDGNPETKLADTSALLAIPEAAACSEWSGRPCDQVGSLRQRQGHHSSCADLDPPHGGTGNDGADRSRKDRVIATLSVG